MEAPDFARKTLPEYFPKINLDGKVSLLELCKSHAMNLEKAYGSENSFKPFGKEPDLQLNTLPKTLFLKDPEILQKYTNFREKFLRDTWTISDKNRHRIAIDYYNKFISEISPIVMKKLESQPKTLAEFQKIENFLKKDAKSLFQDFDKRTAIPMSLVLREVEKQKKKEILHGSFDFETKKKMIAVLDSKFSEFNAKFKNCKIAFQSLESSVENYVFDKNDRNAVLFEVENVAKKFLKGDVFTGLDDGLFRNPLPFEKTTQHLQSAYADLRKLSCNTPDLLLQEKMPVVAEQKQKSLFTRKPIQNVEIKPVSANQESFVSLEM